MPPCLSPCLISKGEKTMPCHLTAEYALLYKLLRHNRNFPCIPTLEIFLRRDSCHTTSKALQTSKVTSFKGPLCLWPRPVPLRQPVLHLQQMSCW